MRQVLAIAVAVLLAGAIGLATEIDSPSEPSQGPETKKEQAEPSPVEDLSCQVSSSSAEPELEFPAPGATPVGGVPQCPATLKDCPAPNCSLSGSPVCGCQDLGISQCTDGLIMDCGTENIFREVCACTGSHCPNRVRLYCGGCPT